MSLGIYPEVSLKNAREKRDELRKMIAAGSDPLIEKADRKKPYTFNDVAAEWLSFKEKSWVERHTKSVRLRIQKYLYQSLGKRPFSELTARDFFRFYAASKKERRMRLLDG